jgi:hypothetical protein
VLDLKQIALVPRVTVREVEGGISYLQITDDIETVFENFNEFDSVREIVKEKLGRHHFSAIGNGM